MTDLSVLIVNYNSWRYCVDALESMEAHPPTKADGSPMTVQVVIVDNDSPQRDEEQEAKLRVLLERMNGVLIMHGENGGYAKGMNLAYEHAESDTILVTNPDVVFHEGCLDGMLRYLESHDNIGVVAPEIYVDRGMTCRLPPNILPTIADLWGATMVAVSPEHVVRYSKKRTRTAMRVWGATEPVDLDQLSGCCFIMERSVIDAIGGLFDPAFPLYYEDTDLTMRIRRAGLRIVEVTGAKMVHLYDRSGQTNNDEKLRRYWISKRKFFDKWYGPWGGWFFAFTRWFVDLDKMHEWAHRPAQPDAITLPSTFEAPVIELPRKMGRFLVEVSMDPRFYLAAATFGEGDRWSPPQTLLECFGPAKYFFRICDLDTPDAEEIGVYEYNRVYPEDRLKMMAEAQAGNQGQGVT